MVLQAYDNVLCARHHKRMGTLLDALHQGLLVENFRGFILPDTLSTLPEL